jgi:hypothetical protein
MLQIHGFPCRVLGLPDSQIKGTLYRLENKYSKELFERISDPDVIFIFTFYVVGNRYKISFEAEYNTILPTLISRKKRKLDSF